MTLRNAEDALLGQELGAVGPRHRLALLGRHVGGLLRRRRAAGAHRADDMRHAPDPVLVGDQELVAAPGEAVGPVQVLDMAVDPFGAALAVVAQQRQIPGALFGDQHIAIRQHQQTARVDQADRERRRGKPFRDGQRLFAKRDDQHPVRDDRTGLRRRQIVRIDPETAADLVLDREILRRRICGGFVLGFCADRGRRQPHHNQGRKPNQQGAQFPDHRALPVLQHHSNAIIARRFARR